MLFPDLTAAAVRALADAAGRSSDGVVRIELHRHADVGAFIDACSDGRRRFGITAPFAAGFAERRPRVTRNPSLITRWRNEPLNQRRAEPIVIVGRATGKSEAGLRRARIVISEQDVLREYRRLAAGWLEREVAIPGPARLFASLAEMALEGQLDPHLIERYALEVFRDPAAAHLRPQAELWRLGLIPDQRSMDSRTPSGRLQLNYHTVEFLLSSPDSAADERQLQRLDAAQAAGNRVATALVRFINTRNWAQLKDVELDDVLEVLRRRNIDDNDDLQAKGPQTVHLWDALDTGDQRVLQLCRDAAANWNPASDDCQVVVDHDELRIKLTAKADRDESVWTSADQVLWTVKAEGADDDSSKKWRAADLLAAAREADALMRVSTAATLTQDYIAAREALAPFFAWAEDALTVLVLKSQLLDAAERYLEAWQSLVSYVLQSPEQASISGLRQYLAYLDGEWEVGRAEEDAGEVQGVRLSHTHPLVLFPLTTLVRFIERSLDVSNIGSQALWAQDRTIPAYPAIWSERATLVHRRGGTRPYFARRGSRQRPETTSKAGIVDVVESYLGLHPFARQHLSLLFVDPPGGNGVPSAVRSIKRLVEELEVVVVHTDSEAVEWATSSGQITSVVRQDSVTSWLESTIHAANVAFVFQPARAALPSSHTGEYRPSRGLQNVLTVSAAPPPVTLAGPQITNRIPFVSVQPRDANEVVHLLMQLAKADDREDRFFQVEPMLDAAEAEGLLAVAAACDWLVIATPSPIGMIPPRKFESASLTYIGRESSGAYGFFVYSRDLFAVRRHVERQMADAPLQPQRGRLEEHIERLALSVPNGVLRIGRGQGDITSQIGLMAASALSHHR